MLEGRNLAKLVTRRFEILEKLYRRKELKLSDLAGQLGKDIGNMSRYVKELEHQGLITVRMQEREKRGKPYKVCLLSDYAKQIIRPYIKQPEKKEIPAWMPKKFLNILESPDKSENMKEFVAGKLTDLAVQNALLIFSIKRFRKLFEKVVANTPTAENSVEKQLRSCLAASILQILESNDKELKNWFHEKIYNKLILMTKKHENAYPWAITTLSKIVKVTNDPRQLSNVIQRLLDIYFEGEKNLADTAKYELIKFWKAQNEIIEKVLAEMEKPERKTKAETLFEELISLWLASG